MLSGVFVRVLSAQDQELVQRPIECGARIPDSAVEVVRQVGRDCSSGQSGLWRVVARVLHRAISPKQDKGLYSAVLRCKPGSAQLAASLNTKDNGDFIEIKSVATAAKHKCLDLSPSLRIYAGALPRKGGDCGEGRLLDILQTQCALRLSSIDGERILVVD